MHPLTLIVLELTQCGHQRTLCDQNSCEVIVHVPQPITAPEQKQKFKRGALTDNLNN